MQYFRVYVMLARQDKKVLYLCSAVKYLAQKFSSHQIIMFTAYILHNLLRANSLLVGFFEFAGPKYEHCPHGPPAGTETVGNSESSICNMGDWNSWSSQGFHEIQKPLKAFVPYCRSFYEFVWTRTIFFIILVYFLSHVTNSCLYIHGECACQSREMNSRPCAPLHSMGGGGGGADRKGGVGVMVRKYSIVRQMCKLLAFFYLIRCILKWIS